jgi:heme exporter protein C
VQGKSLRNLTVASAVALAAAFALVFAYAPMDADQGLIQKIFYLHVPLAIVTLCGFIAGGLMAVGYLRTGDRRWDIRSYVAIHISIVFAVAVLGTGSIWARAAWGHWWVWSEPTLVSFLIIFLLYCCYQPLRFSIEDPERQARYAAVFAVIAGAFVPLNFVAVRLAQAFTHPRVLSATGGNMPGSMRLVFVMAIGAIALVYFTLWRIEIASKEAAGELRRLRRQAAAEFPDDAAVPSAAAPPRHPGGFAEVT